MGLNISFSLGPVWSHWGFRNHSLLLTSHDIIDCTYSTRDSIKLGFALQLPLLKDPEESRRQRAIEGKVLEEELSSLGATFYPVDCLREIRVECRWMQNAVVICPNDFDELTYRLYNRHQTDIYRDAFSQLYPQLYREQGFPTSGIGRLFKS